MVSHFVSVDWSRCLDKRSVYVAHVRERCIRKAEPLAASWNVDAVLKLAKHLSRDAPVLIGVDVVLGVSQGYWQRVLEGYRLEAPKTFVDWLRKLDPFGEFFGTAVRPDQWRVDRPWFNVPKGVGGLTSFTSKVDGKMLRKIDDATGANPVFAVSGIPGTVGSGTREFWKELIPQLSGGGDLALWPFEGDLRSLFTRHAVVLCETYPALAYAAALADDLPTPQISNSKTKRVWREDVCDRLMQVEWVRANRIELGDLGALRENEDDFDAHLTAAAALRCLNDGIEIARPEWIETEAEGSMLIAGVVDPSGGTARTVSGSRGGPVRRADQVVVYRCPIPGCDKVFIGSRGGWDTHVGSVRLHPAWKSSVGDPKMRKRLFREEFGDWFE